MQKSIINVRRLSICWRGRRESDNGRQKTWEIMVMTSLQAESYYHYSDHPRKLVTLNPKLKSTGAGRYYPVGGMLTARRWPERDFPKSQTLWHCSRLRSGALPMIDRGDIRQAIDRCSNICLPPGASAQPEHKADSLIAKSLKKRAERSERLMYEQSHRDYLRSGYLHHRLPVMGC